MANNFEGGNHAIYLLDFYVGGHHIFKVGMSANPWMRNREIAWSLFETNRNNIQCPLYKFVSDVIHWEFSSVWKADSKGANLEDKLLRELRGYHKSLYDESSYDGRDWNKFKGMYEAYPIQTKDVDSMRDKLVRIMDHHTKGNSFYKGEFRYDVSFAMTLNERKK